MRMETVPSSTKYDYQGCCWWCGDLADSREHKWKKAELDVVYGLPGSESYPLTWVDDGGITRAVQGPNSKIMKFEPSICQNCNNSRSQPFDRAYDRWVDYLSANYDKIVERRLVDLRDVVGRADYEDFKLNLAKYFAKHIGCRVADNSAGQVPDSLITFLDGETEESGVAWTELCLSRSALEQHDMMRQRLGMSQTVGNYRRDGKRLTSLKGSLMHGALQLVWDVNLDSSRPDNGNGILSNNSHELRDVGDDLYAHRFSVHDSRATLMEIRRSWRG